MRLLDLFAGIGGFSLAAHWMGWETVAFVEWEDYPQRVLAKNFPGVPIYGDIKEFNEKEAEKYRGSGDIISGGFPCQPFSHAGKRKGKEDSRYLWPEMLKTIQIIRPSWVVGENVAGLLSMDNGRTFETICASMEDEGYEVQPYIIPACAVGAWHRRDRVWIVANNDKVRRSRRQSKRGRVQWENKTFRKINTGVEPIYSNSTSLKQTSSKVEIPKFRGFEDGEDGRRVKISRGRSNVYTPALCRNYDGIPNGLDRIKGLGNAIVPQVAYKIFKAIDQSL